MPEKELLMQDLGAGIAVTELPQFGKEWLLDSEINRHTPATLANRRFFLEKLRWFLQHRGYQVCGPREVRAFLAYVNNGHTEGDGRWGNPHRNKEVRSGTTLTFYGLLRTFFNWLLDQELIEESPLKKIKPPKAAADQVQPFSQEEVSALLAAAKKTKHPQRDTAILLTLLDTGARATELCSLKLSDVDMQGRKCTVEGKGRKKRIFCISPPTIKALFNYLRQEPHEPDDPLFIADRGRKAGEPLTRSGLYQLIERLGEAAAIENVRCSPHTFRHTFAVEFLRGGGNVFTLQQLLGHSRLEMTQKYVALAQADIQNQHRQFSPVERLLKKK